MVKEKKVKLHLRHSFVIFVEKCLDMMVIYIIKINKV